MFACAEDVGSRVEALQEQVFELSARLAEVAETATAGRGEAAMLEQRVSKLEEHLPEGLAREEADSVLAEPVDIQPTEASRPASRKTQYKRPLQYKLGHSVWDAALLLGGPGVGYSASALLLINLLVNAVVQGYICYVLLSSSRFIKLDAFKSLQKTSEQWRSVVAHDVSQVDASGATLVSRVCGQDPTLSVATNQVAVVSEINAYLGLGPDELESQRLGEGPLLCSVCIFLFSVLVLREIREIVTFVVAVAAVPRQRTRLEGRRLVSVSTNRFAYLLVVSLLRLCIAISLLLTGALWLASTTSITDLVLNASALGFIIELDEHLFEAALPSDVHELVTDLEPLPYGKPAWSLDAMLPLMATVGCTALCLAMAIVPSSRDMQEVKRTLCGGRLDFAVATNPVGFVIARPSEAYRAGAGSGSLQLLAVSELRDAPAEMSLREDSMDYSYWVDDRTEFAGLRLQRLKDMVDTQPVACLDMDTARDGAALRKMTYLFTALRAQTGLNEGFSMAERPWRCADHQRFCLSHGLVRFVCPTTCGCDDPRSGLLIRKDCPMRCEDRQAQRQSAQPCADLDVRNHTGWRRYWEGMLWYASQKVSSVNIEALVQRKLALGCSETSADPTTNASFCDDTAFFLTRSSGFATITGFCPATCCSGGLSPSVCPPSCLPQRSRPNNAR